MLKKRNPRPHTHPVSRAKNRLFFWFNRKKITPQEDIIEQANLRKGIAKAKKVLQNHIAPFKTWKEINNFERNLKARLLHSLALEAELAGKPFDKVERNKAATDFDNRLAAKNAELIGMAEQKKESLLNEGKTEKQAEAETDKLARDEFTRYLYQEELGRRILPIEEKLLKQLTEIINQKNPENK